MTKFYICRHGETENNRAKRFQGWIDTPLTDSGIQNAMTSAAKLSGIHLDKIVSSDLGRAFVSAYIISKKVGYIEEIERYPGFREVNYGDFANMPHDTYAKNDPEQHGHFIYPNGESLQQMQDRTIKELQRLADLNEGKTILIVAHDGTINAVHAFHDHMDIGIADQTRNPNDFVAQFDVAGGQVKNFREIS